MNTKLLKDECNQYCFTQLLSNCADFCEGKQILRNCATKCKILMSTHLISHTLISHIINWPAKTLNTLWLYQNEFTEANLLTIKDQL